MQFDYVPVALDELQKRVRTIAANIEGWRCRTAVYAAPGQYDYTSDWRTIRSGDVWGAGDITAFFTCPDVRVPAVAAGKQIGFEIAVDGEGVLKIDGRYYHGIDRNRTFIPLLGNCAGGAVLDLEMEVAGRLRANDPISDIAKQVFHFRHTRLAIIDKATEALWFDLQWGWDTAQVIEQEDVKAALLHALYKAVIQLNFHDSEGPAFAASVVEASATYHQLLAQIDYGKVGGRLHLMGHSHIDVAWKWQLKETVRKCSRTFSTAVTLMEEFPYYQFTCSQPQLYQYTKKYYPELYARIKDKVAAGQWEPTGSTWVEMDCNIPSGESLVRQFLYGKRFFQDEFGVETRVLWLPDVFGYSAALPQIMKRAGVDYFLTNKLRWNDTNAFPHSMFQWEGIDGTRVLAHVPPSHGYNGKMDAKQLYAQWKGFSPKHVLRDVAYTYGHGDGGGGVTREMLERVKRVADHPGLPQGAPDTSHSFFDGIASTMPALPVWRGELYFEFHRGTYTTQALTKRYNRKSEILYRELELWASLASQVSSYVYPAKTLRDGWEVILLNQFHDIIPGSSIAEVYADATEQYGEITTAGQLAFEDARRAVATRVHRSGAPASVVVFNSRSWLSTDCVEVPLPANLVGQSWLVQQDNGELVPTQLTEVEGASRLVFLANDVPAMGYKTFSLVLDASGVAVAPSLSPVVMGAVKDDSGRLREIETAIYRLQFSTEGRLVGIHDKENDRAIISPSTVANDWQLFEDRPGHHPAWDIEPHYKDKPLGVEQVGCLELTENGPVYAVIRYTKQIGRADFTQEIVLYGHSRRIDFRTCGEWQEKEALLKVAFPVLIRSSYATYDIAYGAVERPTHENTSWEQAQFEVSGHKWADLSEGDYGVSLLNDCKYGYDIRDNQMRLTLLRAPVFPDPHADEGRHEFTYALYPHRGTWREGGTVQAAYNLNQPFTAVVVTFGAGSLPRQQSMVTSSLDHVVVEVVKAAEDQPNALVVRAYEAYGQRGAVELKFGTSLSTAYECDLLERELWPVDHDGHRLRFSIEPFQIRSFKITPLWCGQENAHE